MSNKLKFLILFICLVLIAGISIHFQNMEALNFEAEGQVIEAKWNTKNHQMSLFLIREKNSTKKLHSHRVIMQPGQIKVGDSFKKVSGSKVCLINDVEILCVD